MTPIDPPEDLLSAYLDDEVTPDERALVEERLHSSAEWREVLEELRGTRALLRGMPMQEAPAGFWESVAPSDDPAAVPIGTARHRRNKRVVGWLAGAAAAAAFVGVLVIPGESEVEPSVATFMSRHAARSSVSGEPVSQLAPVTPPVRMR